MDPVGPVGTVETVGPIGKVGPVGTVGTVGIVETEWISSGHVARLLIGLLEYTVAFGIYSCSARRLPDYDISAFFLASIEGRRGAQ